MLAPLIVALLFLAGVLWNLLSPHGCIAEAEAGFGIVVLLAWLAWYVYAQDKAGVAFLRSVFDLAGTEQALATRVTSYRLTFSCLYARSLFAQGYYPAGDAERWWSFWWCTLLTAIFGGGTFRWARFIPSGRSATTSGEAKCRQYRNFWTKRGRASSRGRALTDDGFPDPRSLPQWHMVCAVGRTCLRKPKNGRICGGAGPAN